jgi:hypothetical protein
VADSLRDELLSIPGIEEAELEGDAETPAGVRVRLSADADTDSVGEEVRRVLATYGMRSHVTTAAEPASPPPPPGAPASVVTLPGVSVAPPPAAFGDAQPVTGVAAPDEVITEPQAPAEPVPAEPPAPAVATPPVALRRLHSAAVEEGRAGVTVRVSADDGAVAERRARPGEAGLDEAVVSATAELVDGSAAPPLLIEVVEQEVAGTPLMTVVLELADGARCAGSAVADGGRVYAIAHATWLALSDL